MALTTKTRTADVEDCLSLYRSVRDDKKAYDKDRIAASDKLIAFWRWYELDSKDQNEDSRPVQSPLTNLRLIG